MSKSGAKTKPKTIGLSAGVDSVGTSGSSGLESTHEPSVVADGLQVYRTHSASAVSQTVYPVQSSSVVGSHPRLESTAVVSAAAS